MLPFLLENNGAAVPSRVLMLLNINPYFEQVSRPASPWPNQSSSLTWHPKPSDIPNEARSQKTSPLLLYFSNSRSLLRSRRLLAYLEWSDEVGVGGAGFYTPGFQGIAHDENRKIAIVQQ